MITWRKLMRSAQFLLPNVIFAVVTCCQHGPVIYSVTPNFGSQGTDFIVNLVGNDFSTACGGDPILVIDGSRIEGVSADFPSHSTETEITCTLHIAPNARLGAHTIVVQNAYSGMSDPFTFLVTCPGCPPPPELLNVYNQSGLPLIPGGPPVTFEFIGTNFLNNNPQVQIDGPGISFPSGNIIVQDVGGIDYFDLPITADASATSGLHNVRVTTDGGTSNDLALTVDASQPPSGTPGPTPYLSGITPRHISKSGLWGVWVKFQGTGFGCCPQIIVDANSTVQNFSAWPTNQANPDEVVVGLTSADPAGTDTSVTVRIFNPLTNQTSDGQILFVDDLVPGAPVVTSYTQSIELPPDADADFTIFGQNLLGVTEQSFSGIPGLTFSNVQPVAGNPPDRVFSCHVHADATTPVTGDEATNLIITTTNGQSHPFSFEIYPPPLPP